MNIDHLTFANIIETAISVVNSGPAMFTISTISFVIYRRLNRLNQQEIYNQIVKKANVKIQNHYDLARDDIERRVNDVNDHIKANQSSAVQQAVEVIEEVDSSLLNVSVEGWHSYSDQDKSEIVAAMRQRCRFGKHDLGKMEVDVNTGRLIKQ